MGISIRDCLANDHQDLTPTSGSHFTNPSRVPVPHPPVLVEPRPCIFNSWGCFLPRALSILLPIILRNLVHKSRHP